MTQLRRVRRTLGLTAAALALIATGAVLAWFALGWWGLRFGPAAGEKVVQLPLTPPVAEMRIGRPAVSPDGSQIAFVSETPGEPSQLWIRQVGEAEAHPIEGTDGAYYPSWSLDNKTIGYGDRRSGLLKRVGIDGTPRVIAEAPEFIGGTWNRDGMILFAPRFLDVLYRVPVDGGAPQPLTMLDSSRHELSHRFPQFLPAGRRFLVFVRSEQPQEDGVFWGALDDARLRRVVPSTTMGTFVEPDQLLIVRDGVLEVQRLRMADLQPVDDARPLLGQMRAASNIDPQMPPVSATPSLLVYSPLTPQRTRFVEFDRTGRRLRSLGGMGYDDSPAALPDGKRIIVRRTDPASGTSNLWLYEGTAATPLLRRPSMVGRTVWLDDRQILFSERLGLWRMRILDLDRPGEIRTIGTISPHQLVLGVSPDRRQALFQESGGTGWSLKIMPIEGKAHTARWA